MFCIVGFTFIVVRSIGKVPQHCTGIVPMIFGPLLRMLVVPVI
jgi:fructose-specific phosphotransferase system IIC component